MRNPSLENCLPLITFLEGLRRLVWGEGVFLSSLSNEKQLWNFVKNIFGPVIRHLYTNGQMRRWLHLKNLNILCVRMWSHGENARVSRGGMFLIILIVCSLYLVETEVEILQIVKRKYLFKMVVQLFYNLQNFYTSCLSVNYILFVVEQWNC